jgi:DNA-binding transcriptional MerR regulator
MINGKYTIGDVARKYGVAPWTLRRLEQLGHIPAPRRDPFSRKRVYSETDVERLGAMLTQYVEQRIEQPM